MASILVVDDEQAINRALELKLLHNGFTVTSALNGIEALEQLPRPGNWQEWCPKGTSG